MADDPFLSWRHTFEPGPDFVLERARPGSEPEIIGRVMRYTASAVAGRREGWRWSLTCHLPIVGMEPLPINTSGTEDTKREACDALGAAWRVEVAWREAVRARPEFERLSPEVRDHIVKGQPVPAKWKGGG